MYTKGSYHLYLPSVIMFLNTFYNLELNSSYLSPSVVNSNPSTGWFFLITNHGGNFFILPNPKFLLQVQEKLPTMEKTSMLRTLKDHLYQCPTKLSEEMVRCMAAVYCWLRNSASSNLEQNRSPLLSRSSTNVVLPRRGISEESDRSCKSVIEISSISTEKNHFSRASYAINNYRWVSCSLQRTQV